MIQINLLPDIKLEYLRSKRMKRLVILVSSAVAGVGIATVCILFFAVNILQKNYIKDLSRDIDTSISDLKGTKDLDKILTIQNQLVSLPDLHTQKPVTSRLYRYLAQITPENATISKLEVDFSLKTIQITGVSDSLSTNNKFVDTLKFTKFSAQQDGSTQSDLQAFSNVVLTSFGRTDNEASYVIDFNFDAGLFDSSKEVALTIPQIITTRSETEKPLFEEQLETLE